MIRAFVAVELSASVRDALARLQDGLKSELIRAVRASIPNARVQWVNPGSLHVTLKFLGDVEEASLETIRGALSRVGASSSAFRVLAGGLGVFPDLRAPRILWVGMHDEQERGERSESRLVRLAREVDRALTDAGFSPELRPFSPHLTLARIKERSREIGKIMTDGGFLTGTHEVGGLDVHALSLMRSELKPSGAIYTRLFEVPLKRNP